MQSFRGNDIRFDQRVKRLRCRGTCSDLIGQRGKTEVDAHAGLAFALAVERLVLRELVKEDHRSKFARLTAGWGRGRTERGN